MASSTTLDSRARDVRAGIDPNSIGDMPTLRTPLAALALVALLASTAACAETRVILMRGWFGVFSSGIDAMTETLRGQGVQAEAIGHLAWRAAARRIVQERAQGKPGKVVLVGHSQGGNNTVDIARELKAFSIPVDLIVTLAPWKQDPVPANVLKAVNYYQAGGWGSPLVGEADFKGELVNLDIGPEPGITHVNIDKSPRVQAEVVRAIVALVR